MLFMLLVACNPSLKASDVRRELDAPSARLDASTLPQITDDLFQGSAARNGEASAWNWSGRADSSPSAGLMSPTRGPAVTQGLLGGVGCAVGTLASIDSSGDCGRGNSCKTKFVLRSCLLDDPLAQGRIAFTVEQKAKRDYDQGKVTIDFRDWGTSGAEGYLDHLDGAIEVESTSWDDRDELIYTSDFTAGTWDLDAPASERVLNEQRVRGALRFVSETDGDDLEASVEVLGWIDEDGDGEDDGSIVLRLSTQVLDEGSFVGATFEVIDAQGTWTCSFTAAEESRADGTTWTSAGTCTDPDGNAVDFDGVVRR